jgi:pimeloyl-ACP methyl ester carboxylesterase
MSLQQAIILPATDPHDVSFGIPPQDDFASLTLTQVAYDRLVWYNASVRACAWEQIQTAGLQPNNALIGFSKSGLGAINLCCDYPGKFRHCVIFDSPLTLAQLPPWETEAFYTQATWAADLPLHQLARIATVSQRTDFIAVTGRLFRQAMLDFHAQLVALGGHATLLDLDLPHRWDSGWLPPSLACIYAAAGA